MSYNPTGLDSTVKCRFSNSICSEYDVDFLAVQEHFKFISTTDKYFRKKFLDYYSYVIPGYRSPGQDSGRAKAGLAQLTSKKIQVTKERVETVGFRVQAQVLYLPTTKVLWLNSYFPTDPQNKGEYDDSVLREVLEQIESFIRNNKYDDIIWGSDLNWDTSRKTFFAKTVSSFVE